MLKPEKVKQINEREEEREERDYAEGKRLLFFCPGKSRLTGGRWAVWGHSDHIFFLTA